MFSVEVVCKLFFTSSYCELGIGVLSLFLISDTGSGGCGVKLKIIEGSKGVEMVEFSASAFI